MNEREALREHIYGVNSHLHILHALEGLDPHTARGRFPPAAHTIFEILHHMVYWQDLTIARLRGDRPESPPRADLGWPAASSPADSSDLEAPIACLAEGLRTIEGMLADSEFDLDRVCDGQRRTTAREEILMVQSHNSYHLGQIVLLRQELDAWPPPKGGDTW